MNRIHRSAAVAFASLIGLGAAADTVDAAPAAVEEEVAFYYNKIAFQYATTADGSQASDAADYVIWRKHVGTGG
jgi:hypothetical protein